jgi:fibronectin type 3 domain-containing protein
VGGVVTKIVTVSLTVTLPPVQHVAALSWKASTNSHIVSYSLYRSSTSGSSYALSASAIGGAGYSDQGVQSGTTYYYVVTSVDDQDGRVSIRAKLRAVIP